MSWGLPHPWGRRPSKTGNHLAKWAKDMHIKSMSERTEHRKSLNTKNRHSYKLYGHTLTLVLSCTCTHARKELAACARNIFRRQTKSIPWIFRIIPRKGSSQLVITDGGGRIIYRGPRLKKVCPPLPWNIPKKSTYPCLPEVCWQQYVLLVGMVMVKGSQAINGRCFKNNPLLFALLVISSFGRWS